MGDFMQISQDKKVGVVISAIAAAANAIPLCRKTRYPFAHDTD
jgi:hypothetical protein